MKGARSIVIAAATCALLLFAGSASAQEEGDPGPGRWRLSTDGERYSLWANGVPIEEVLDGIQRMASGRIQIKKTTDAKVSARCFNVTLDELLSRLGLEYFLMFGRDKDNAYGLESGWLGYDPGRKAGASSKLTAIFAPVGAPAGSGASTASSPEVRARLTGSADGVTREEDVGEVYRAAFPVPVAMNGDLGDWPGMTPWQRVTHEMGPAPATNDADASFEVAGLSDGTNVYFGVRITDDLKAVTNAAQMPLKFDDGLHLHLAGTDGAPGVDFIINRHHVLMKTADGMKLAARQYVSQSAGTYAVIADGEKGWNVEIAVPLPLLGTDLQGKREVAFNLVLRDRDAGVTNEHTLAWSRTARLGDLSQAGRLQFVDIR